MTEETQKEAQVETTTTEKTEDPIQEKQKRVQACGKEIQEVLVKYNCVLDVTMTIGSRGVLPNINIIPKETTE